MKSPSDPEARLQWAARIVERGRFNKKLFRLRRALGPLFWQLRASRYELGRCFPLLGALDGLEERGGLDPSTLRRDRPRLSRIKARLALRLLVWWKDYFGRSLWKKYPRRPGWNDYWMTVWFMTGNPKHAQEIYTRAVAVPGPDADEDELYTLTTARWMVSSVRGQHPDFDAQISALESHFGVPVLSLVPPGVPDFRPAPPLPAGVCSRCGCNVSGPTYRPGPACNCPCHPEHGHAGLNDASSRRDLAN